MFILKKHTHSRHTWHSSNRYTVNSLKKHTHLTHTSKSVYSVHLVQSFGLWRGMCPGSPVDTISVFRVESVRHGREINFGLSHTPLVLQMEVLCKCAVWTSFAFFSKGCAGTLRYPILLHAASLHSYSPIPTS